MDTFDCPKSKAMAYTIATQLGLPANGIKTQRLLQVWAVAESITPFLFSPETDHLCAPAAAEMVRTLLPPDIDVRVSLRLLRTERPLCLEGLVRFASVSRTEEQLKALETNLAECSCPIASSTYLQMIHEDETQPTDLTLQGVVNSVFGVLGMLFFDGFKVGHIVGGASATETDSATTKWPPNISALFPTGQEDAVLSFTRLYRYTRSYAVLNYIRNLLPHCPSLARPISECDLIWKVTIEFFEEAVNGFEGFTVAQDREYDDQWDERLWPEQTVRCFVMFVSSFISAWVERLGKDIAASGLAPHGRKVYSLFLKVLHVAHRHPDQVAQQVFAYCAAVTAGVVFMTVPRPERPKRPHPLVTTYSGSRGGAYEETLYSVSRLVNSVQCCNPPCTQTSESCSKKLRYCSQCRLVRYCSTSCQKTAWKDHKTVCVDLEKLNRKIISKFDKDAIVTAGQLSEGSQHFEDECRKLGFTEDRMRELHEEVARAVGQVTLLG
ncbi:hypothetical protein R3P38DRAFT_2889392 [Favolaschia claudopus]|uniref:MYND-type domain-containing protein n=1 Tax=Favolaschia claudopus TaxID=2862362 RepID=A0AAW0CTR0_9AGAR